jgi:hypothetical protein
MTCSRLTEGKSIEVFQGISTFQIVKERLDRNAGSREHEACPKGALATR